MYWPRSFPYKRPRFLGHLTVPINSLTSILRTHDDIVKRPLKFGLGHLKRSVTLDDNCKNIIGLKIFYFVSVEN